MKFFVDTNIFLDIIQDRVHAPEGVEFVNTCISNKYKIYVSWHTLSNIFYVMEKQYNKELAKTSVTDILYFATVATVGHEDAKNALDLNLSDFEDALQIVSAEAVDADFIITRNKKDFIRSPIKVMTPEELDLPFA
jgi:predicted nucleic acid-binding protein